MRCECLEYHKTEEQLAQISYELSQLKDLFMRRLIEDKMLINLCRRMFCPRNTHDYI
jgi:hypothetical protein